jgi:hypothetical protein
MRITIEVDHHADPGNPPTLPGQPATPAATFDLPDDGTNRAQPGALHPSGALDAGAAAADPGPAADPGVPADLLARAAALNALSAGRAPDLSAPADAAASSTAHAPSTTGVPADAPDHFACAMAPGEFEGITNAGGPAPGSGADAP